MQDGFKTVGKVKDAHGLKGELYVLLFAGEADWLDQLEELRLLPPGTESSAEEGAQPLILKVKSARPHKSGLIVQTPDLRNRNEAEALKGYLLEIPLSFLESEPGDAIYLHEIEGFTVETSDKGEVGQIVGFSDNGLQDLLVIRTPKNEEYEVPFVDAFVEKIDWEGRRLHMNLPYGLLGELDEDDSKSQSKSPTKSKSDGGPDGGADAL